MHLIEAGGYRLLLDCGLRMGMSNSAQRRNREFPFSPKELDAVIISHAHVDHCGNLPNLVRQGFQGPVYCTPATRTLMNIMLNDSARIQAEEAETDLIVHGPDETTTGSLYTSNEVDWALEQTIAVPYEERREILHGVELRFVDAGHLLGSAMTSLTFDVPGGKRRLTYTGDLGRASMRFLRQPGRVPEADLILCESTYGGRVHKPIVELQATLEAGRQGDGRPRRQGVDSCLQPGAGADRRPLFAAVDGPGTHTDASHLRRQSPRFRHRPRL